MKMIQTGKTPVSLLTLIAVFSISLVVNLPGLAISPILEKLRTIFPHTTDLEIQLLTTLPNVLIIPFVLLAGKFSESRHKVAIISLGVIIFAACAVAYLFANSMAALIVISSLLGAGAGILIPFSTGLLSDIFSGQYKMKQMGIQVGVANITLVAVTYIVGWMQNANWHVPFTVYLIILIPLALLPFLRGIPGYGQKPAAGSDDQVDKNRAIDLADIKTELVTHPTRFAKNGISYTRLAGVFGVYFLTTYLTIVISYYAPFTVATRHWAEDWAGTVTSVYFLLIFLSGFLLAPVVRIFKSQTTIACALALFLGLGIIYFVPEKWGFILGAVLCGFGYGVLQPLMYDKSTRCVNDPDKSTLAMSIVLAANYVAVVIAPFIVDPIRELFGFPANGTFPYLLNFVIAGIFLVVTLVRRNAFSLYIRTSYFEKKKAADPKTTDN